MRQRAILSEDTSQQTGKLFSSHRTPDDSHDLPDEFWASVDYCGYLRRTYEPGSVATTSLFVNEAYARLVGIDRVELISRPRPLSRVIENAFAGNLLHLICLFSNTYRNLKF